MEQKAFYEIERPVRTTKTAFLLVEVNENRADTALCQHFITNRKHCTQYADETCEFCGIWTCYSHFDHKKGVWIEELPGFGGTGGWRAAPCSACSTLSTDDLLKMRALRLELNRA